MATTTTMMTSIRARRRRGFVPSVSVSNSNACSNVHVNKWRTFAKPSEEEREGQRERERKSKLFDMNLRGDEPPSFYSFFSEEEVFGPSNSFVMYRYESYCECNDDEQVSDDQYDYLEGRSLKDNRVTKFLLEQAKLPVLWTSSSSSEGEGGEEEKCEEVEIISSKSKRRTKKITFTCKLCKTRMAKLINPHAWENGTIVIQCTGCGVKHEMVDNLGLFDLLNKKTKKTPKGLEN